MKLLKLSMIALSALMFTTSSCNKEDEMENEARNPGNSMQVKMTDAPGDYAALDVEILKVEAYLQDSGWITLNNSAQMVSVLDLTNGAETSIAFNSNVSAGLYTQVKLTFGSSNTLTLLADGSLGGTNGSVDIELGWTGSQEVIIDINEEVSSESGAVVLLDFNVAQSIIETGQDYILTPIITEVKNASTGVQGEVEGAANAAVILTDGNNTVSTYIDANGRFLLRGVPSGVYDLLILPSSEDIDNGMPSQHQIEGVVVASGEFTQMGSISL